MDNMDEWAEKKCAATQMISDHHIYSMFLNEATMLHET